MHCIIAAIFAHRLRKCRVEVKISIFRINRRNKQIGECVRTVSFRCSVFRFRAKFIVGTKTIVIYFCRIQFNLFCARYAPASSCKRKDAFLLPFYPEREKFRSGFLFPAPIKPFKESSPKVFVLMPSKAPACVFNFSSIPLLSVSIMPVGEDAITSLNCAVFHL